ncbi:hypothetical protein CC86DRAFT_371145, partial [Ophiobolus disseminans]
MNWASVALKPLPPPTPLQRWNALVNTYAAKSLRLVLLEVLGLLETPLSSAAAPLIKHCVVVCVDTEAWTANTDEMTEIGLVICEHKDGKELGDDVGDYAENLLKKMRYYHLRIWENAHLKTTADWMRGAEGNRFGGSRFVTFAKARSILDFILNQPIVSDDPDVAGLKRPVILVGQALDHDTENLQKSGLAYNFRKHGTVVKEIDTQKMTKELNAWVDKSNPGNDIGLDTLCEEVFDFVHDDAHTALNDAARTMMCAVNLALRTFAKSYRSQTKKTIQEVAHELEQHSRDVFTSTWGTELSCTRCGGRDHSNDEDQCMAAVYCNACDRFDETTPGVAEDVKQRHISSHIDQFCLDVAEFYGWKRRVIDAHRKDNPLPPGPPPGSHPRYTWPGKWPMTDPSDALLPEVPEFDRIMGTSPRIALDLPKAPAPPPDVKTVMLQSTARKQAVQARRVKEKVGLGGAGSTPSSGADGRRASSLGSDDAWTGTAW